MIRVSYLSYSRYSTSTFLTYFTSRYSLVDYGTYDPRLEPVAALI